MLSPRFGYGMQPAANLKIEMKSSSWFSKIPYIIGGMVLFMVAWIGISAAISSRYANSNEPLEHAKQWLARYVRAGNPGGEVTCDKVYDRMGDVICQVFPNGGQPFSLRCTPGSGCKKNEGIIIIDDDTDTFHNKPLFND